MIEFVPAVTQGVSPAALRNAAPIAAVLAKVFAQGVPRGGTVLEIASGGGYHACAFAAVLPQYRWQPTEADAQSCGEIAQRAILAQLAHIAPPLVLDVTQPWPVQKADAIVCINMVHIAPWAAALALFAGAARLLPPGAPLVTYGPYLMNGDYQAESNRSFDASLKARNPAWGIREMSAMADAAKAEGFAHTATHPMPANNHVLVFRKNEA